MPLSAEERAELLRAVRKAKPAFTPPRPPVPPPQVNTSPLLREIYAKVSWGLWPGICGGRGAGRGVAVSGCLGPFPSLLAGSAPPTPMLAEGRLLWGAHAAPSSVSTWRCSCGPSVGVSQGLCALPKTGQLAPQAAGSGRGHTHLPGWSRA